MSSAIVVAIALRRFICRACGYIYDERDGDPDSGVAAGTRFDDIPDDWSCPLCGVTKADFEPFDDSPPPRRTNRQPADAGRSVGARSRRDDGVVIVGGGRAGWAMAAALRERDADATITLVASDTADVYDKPLLSVAMARGLDVATLAREPAERAAGRLGVRLLVRTHAVRVQAEQHLLRTTRGTLRWRHLVLAHGAAPRPLAELPGSLCWRINDLDAYRRFRTALGAVPGPASVLVVGAGLVGCELSNDLALAGHAVTLLDVAERPLAGLLDPAGSAELLEAWRALPLRFVGGARVARVARAPGGALHVDANVAGALVPHEVDHIVAATGLFTPSRLAVSAGLAVDGGISVDAVSLATSHPAIHALGDCIAIDGLAHRYIEPIARQARRIAATIVGDLAAPDYGHRRPPVRIKTTTRPFTVA